ncbi:MAG: selenium metabolism-associated LysR family transcriptional regulator [Deferrisomatales bacterium]
MTYHQLRVFLAVADAGHFARGAEVLHLSQPTVSQHIAALEEELGLALLDRSRKGVTLTEAGKLLRRHARRVVGAMEATREAVERFRGLEGVPLRVGVSTIPGTYLVPVAMPELFASHPGLRLVLVQGDSRETLDRVASDDVEVGMVGSRFDQRGLAYTPVGSDTIRLMVAPDHPWARAGAIALSGLAEQWLVLRESGSGTGKTVGEALRRAGVDPSSLRVRAQVGSTEALKAAVASGVGAAFLSEWACQKEVERGELVAVPVEGLAVERSFHLVRRAGRTLSPAAAAFWEVMAAHFGGPPVGPSAGAPMRNVG